MILQSFKTVFKLYHTSSQWHQMCCLTGRYWYWSNILGQNCFGAKPRQAGVVWRILRVKANTRILIHTLLVNVWTLTRLLYLRFTVLYTLSPGLLSLPPYSNIQSMREQLNSLGLCFNWDRVSRKSVMFGPLFRCGWIFFFTRHNGMADLTSAQSQNTFCIFVAMILLCY